MSDKAQLAKKLFLDGYNCSQAVFGAYAEDFGIDFSTAMKISSGFGGGFGRMREVCGAVSGMTMVLGLKYGYDNPKANELKAQLYKKVQQYAEKYKEENGSIVCRELLGLSKAEKSSPIPSERTEQYYKKRPCSELVEFAAGLIEDLV